MKDIEHESCDREQDVQYVLNNGSQNNDNIHNDDLEEVVNVVEYTQGCVPRVRIRYFRLVGSCIVLVSSVY